MKFYNTLSLALLLMLSTEALAQGISFLDNRPMEEVLSQAKKEGKMVFVDCYATWCVPCKMLSTKVFPQKEAGDFFNPRFVSLKLDMEKGEGPEMGKKLKIMETAIRDGQQSLIATRMPFSDMNGNARIL